jgi:hypothetical protein
VTGLDPLLEALRAQKSEAPAWTMLATVTDVASTGVLVQFDGESIASTRRYRYLGPYGPDVGDRVVMLRSGSTWVVSGPVYQSLGWITFPFAAGWGNYGLGYRTCAYRRIGMIVEVRGLAAYSGGGTSTNPGTLPSGYRPAEQEIFSAYSSAAPTANAVYVPATGVLLTPTAIASGGFVSLSGIRYEADGT